MAARRTRFLVACLSGRLRVVARPVVAVRARPGLRLPALVRQLGRGLQLVIEPARQCPLHGEVGDKADRGAADGEQRDEPGYQPTAQGTG